MANRSGPDFGDVRVAEQPPKWGGRRVPFSNTWLGMMWNFKEEKNQDNLKTADNPKSVDNLRAFWFSNPNIDDEEDENQRWYVLRPLGDGTFGHVALWVREDKDTGRAAKTPLDYCAVKQFAYSAADQYANLPLGVMKEGVYQHQLNKFPECANVLFLRRYKAYFKRKVEDVGRKSKRTRITFVPDTVRAYFDYAPHGELYDLMDKYRAFDKHFPEAFVWHVFHSLARAVLAMNAGPWTRLIKSSRGELKEIKLRKEVFLNHFDMKPSNVFLGFNATGQCPTTATDSNRWNPECEYPQVLLADFGLAEILTQDNKKQDHEDEPLYKDALIHPGFPGNPNPHNHWDEGRVVYGPELDPGRQWNCSGWGDGSASYLPPEQLRVGAHWSSPPNGRAVTLAETKDLGIDGRPTYDAAQTIVREDGDAKGYRFTPASNIWALGKIMHDVAYLMSSDYYQDEFGELPQDAKQQEQRYAEIGGNMLEHRVTKPDYSKELHDLIRKCMDIGQGMRPDAEELVRSTQENLDAWTKAAQTMSVGEREQLRLFYKGHEINQMSPGPNNFYKSDQVFDDIAKNKYLDPALEQLNLPEKGWQGQKRKFEAQQEEGLWRMPQFEVGADGVAYFVPPQVGRLAKRLTIDTSAITPATATQATPDVNGNILDISDPRIQIYRNDLEAEVNASLRQISAMGQGMETSLALARLKQRILVDDKDVIATLLILYSLPPKADENWILVPVSAADGDSILIAHDPVLPQKLRAVDRKLNTWVKNSLDFSLSEQGLTRVRLLESLAAYTRRCIKDGETQHGDAMERIKRLNVLNELLLRYTQTLGDGHQAVCNAPQLKAYVGGIPTNLPFGDLTTGNEAQISGETATNTDGNEMGNAGPENSGQKKGGRIPPTQPATQPAATRPGDYRGQDSDGIPRYYCKHSCRTGTRPDGGKCGHICCKNGARTKPK